LILTGAQTGKARFGISKDSGRLIIRINNDSCFPAGKTTDAAGREWKVKDLINFNGKVVKIDDDSEVYEVKNLRVMIS
jgi:lysyl-tRNA synthetase class II